MTITIAPISFGLQLPIKKDWKKGLMPQVKNGIYGVPLTKKNITQEHVVPAACGGETTNENIVFADAEMNNQRATTPLMDVITYEQLFDYLYEWVDVETENIRGADYICGIIKTIGDVERHRKEWIA